MNKSFENSEHHLYKNYLMELAGNYEQALEHLEKIRTQVLDSHAWREAKGSKFNIPNWIC